MAKFTEEEKDKWWKLRNNNPPVMPADIAKRFGAKAYAVRAYLHDRALRESTILPSDPNAISEVIEKTKGKWNSKL